MDEYGVRLIDLFTGEEVKGLPWGSLDVLVPELSLPFRLEVGNEVYLWRLSLCCNAMISVDTFETLESYCNSCRETDGRQIVCVGTGEEAFRDVIDGWAPDTAPLHRSLYIDSLLGLLSTLALTRR